MIYRKCRNGVITIEVAMAATIMAAAAIAMTLLLTLAMKQFQLSARETSAILEASNILERTYAIPYEKLQSGPVPFDRPAVNAEFNNTTVTFTVVELTNEPTPADDAETGRIELKRKKVTVEIAWGETDSPICRPVSLSTWRYAEEEAP